MATLIIEIQGRHGHQYHRIDRPEVCVGRALDNDIILPDPTVSPHHFSVRRRADGNYELFPLDDENGIRIGRRRLAGPVALSALPLRFEAGRTQVCFLDREQAVDNTRLLPCRRGGICLFGHWGWALALFLLMLPFSAIENYLLTFRSLTWDSFWSDQLPINVFALVFWIVLLIVNRILVQRWESASSLAFVSLMLILFYTLNQLTALADYLWTSALPGHLARLFFFGLLLPLALGGYLIRLQHGNRSSSLLTILVLVGPFTYMQYEDMTEHYDWLEEFSDKALYSREILPWDQRLKPTLSIEQFMRVSAEAVAPETLDRDPGETPAALAGVDLSR